MINALGANVEGLNVVVNGQLWSLSITDLQVSLKGQLNTILFAKTLLRKDVTPSSVEKGPEKASPPTNAETASNTSALADQSGSGVDKTAVKKADGDKDFGSKAQVMTLMTTDVDRVAGSSMDFFVLVDAPLEIAVAAFYLYWLLGT